MNRLTKTLLYITLTVIISFLFRPLALRVDELIYEALQPVHRSEEGALYTFAELITVLGGSTAFMLIIATLSVAFYWRKQWQWFIFMVVFFVGGVLINTVLKQIIARDRPYGIEKSIDYIGEVFNLLSYSFPSGHSFRAMMLALFLSFLVYQSYKLSRFKRIISVGLMILAIVIALSRVVLAVHFPSDIIAAVLYASVWFVILKMWLNPGVKEDESENLNR